MAIASISSGMAFVLLALSVPVPNTAPPLRIEDHRFDLASVTLAQPYRAETHEPAQRFGKPRHDPAILAGERWTPPSKTWGIGNDGPVLQIGALGTRDKRIPDLAHISLDWDF
jgi:hypothetical protein